MKKLFLILIPLLLYCMAAKTQTWVATNSCTVTKDTTIIVVNDKKAQGKTTWYLETWWTSLNATTATGNLLQGQKILAKTSWLHDAGAFSDTFQLSPATFKRLFYGDILPSGLVAIQINHSTVSGGVFNWNFYAKKE